MNLNITDKLGIEKQEITIAEGKTYTVNCGAKTMIKAQEIFKKDNLEFRFKMIMWDNVAKKNVKSILANKSINQEYNYIRSRLSTYKVDGRNVLLDLKLDINDIKISISHIDIYKKYLGNIKFINKN